MSTDRPVTFCGEREDLLAPLITGYRRILVWGDMGAGKSTLALKLLSSLTTSLKSCQILELDPGSPPFGIPGAVCRGWLEKDEIRFGNSAALCSLDASRFRLPLSLLARSLVRQVDEEKKDTILLIDPPGVVKGVGGAELLLELTESLEIDMVLVLFWKAAPLPLAQELAALHAEKLYIPASALAKRPSRFQRIKHRTRLWDNFLKQGAEETVQLDRLHLLGTVPPLEAVKAWKGRQAALLDSRGRTVRLGEVAELHGKKLTLKMVRCNNGNVSSLLIRDAGRDAAGRLATILPVTRTAAVGNQPAEMTPPVLPPNAGYLPISSHLGPAWATLVGGALGDPLLHVRLKDLKKSLLFDLGDPARLAAKVAHQVSAVFLSHAHLDHIGGFVWFLRLRIGLLEPCKIFGPVGTIDHIEHFIQGVTWDRIKEKGPVFEVGEIGQATIRRARLQAGKERINLPETTINNGVILTDEHFIIKAVICDHRTPSIAYALVFGREIKVRKERLKAKGVAPGPWLGRLKYCIANESPQILIELPNGMKQPAGELAEELTFIVPGKKMVYAADMADSPDNRIKLTELARSAHTLFCEAAFTMEDQARADANQHLTTFAAATIAGDAGVERLVPFHFSKRYAPDYQVLYDEILANAGRVQVLGHFSR